MNWSIRSVDAAVAAWCGRRDSNPHILRYWYLKPARLPIPPRPRGRSSKCAGYSKECEPCNLVQRDRRCNLSPTPVVGPVKEMTMSDDPRPDQLPPFPSEPAEPSEAPNEAPPSTPDIDVPAPSSPGTDPSTTPSRRSPDGHRPPPPGAPPTRRQEARRGASLPTKPHRPPAPESGHGRARAVASVLRRRPERCEKPELRFREAHPRWPTLRLAPEHASRPASPSW